MDKDKNESRIGLNFFEVGCVLAMIVSWSANESMFWAVVHGALNWFYIIYYMIIN